MKSRAQLCFELIAPQKESEPLALTLKNETRVALIALMQRILIAVVRNAEVDDDR